jgi:(heptosyl)LPS beta-1,4-glucosyltransferase
MRLVSKISVVINTLNEEKNLPSATASVKGLASEIVVVDMKSDDRTQVIAKKAGAKVFEYERVGYVEPARNYAIEKTTGDWVLILDADEKIPLGLAKKLKEIIKSSKADYYRLPRKNIIFGKWIKHSRWWPDYNIRFFKKGKVSWSEVIHSVPMTKGKGMDLPEKEEYAIIHNSYNSVEQFIERLNRYSSIQAKLLIKDGYKFSWQHLITKPTSEFLGRYFVGEGYKDGVPGLVLGGLQAFSELAVYAKVWQYEKFEDKNLHLNDVNKELKKSINSFKWWITDSKIKSQYPVLSFPLKVLRRLFQKHV